MPELPEVETVARQLRSILVGKTVNKVNIMYERVVDNNISNIVPFSIKSVSRRGKWIIIELTNKKHLLTHLRMTGHFHHVKDPLETKHERFLAATFHLNDNTSLTHNSIRRFGSIQLLTKHQLKNKLSKQGYEPLEIDTTTFINSIQKYPNTNIKNKLLDQHFLAGVGNIYAQEALYHAKIHPLKKVHQISKKKLTALNHHLQLILKKSIENNGTTVNNYTNIDGKGNFQNLLVVYTKNLCPKNHKIRKIKIAGRGTYFCNKCQR